VGKRYLSNARRTYGRARLSASEHDGKSYIRAGSDKAANGWEVIKRMADRRCRERFALDGRTVLVTGGAARTRS